MRVKFDRYLATKPYLAQDIELLSETLEGEFKGGRDLPMCCGYETGFSKQEALGSGAPERAWRAVEGLVYHTCDSGAISARPAGASDTWCVLYCCREAYNAVEGLVNHTCDSGTVSARPAGESDTRCVYNAVEALACLWLVRVLPARATPGAFIMLLGGW